ncbi:hypothetical protein DXG01_000470 [Tephrocybe rancida]|nr:hypothetical protein DXG01_000470 [Tephrocybe rancida]
MWRGEGHLFSSKREGACALCWECGSEDAVVQYQRIHELPATDITCAVAALNIVLNRVLLFLRHILAPHRSPTILLHAQSTKRDYDAARGGLWGTMFNSVTSTSASLKRGRNSKDGTGKGGEGGESMELTAFSLRGTVLAVAGRGVPSGDAEVYLWDVEERRCVMRWKDEGGFRGVGRAMVGKGGFLAVGSNTGFMNVYGADSFATVDLNMVNPKPRKSIANLTTPISVIRLNRDAQLMAVASQEKDVMRFVSFLSCLSSSLLATVEGSGGH